MNYYNFLFKKFKTADSCTVVKPTLLWDENHFKFITMRGRIIIVLYT